MSTYEIVGWIGGISLALCSVPQCIQTFKTKKADDISLYYLYLWILGVVLVSYYLIVKSIYTCGDLQYQLLFNYVCNFIMALYLLYAKLTYK